MLSRILAICLGLMTACYSPPEPDCGFECGSGGACPSDYFCATDGVCHRNGTSMTMMCRADARPDSPRPIDAVPIDADQTPPQVFQTMPADGATNVPRSTTIRVQFNEGVLNVNDQTFLVSGGAGAIAGTIVPDSAILYTFIPTSALPATDSIVVTLTGGIYDNLGNPLVQTTFAFQTAP